MQLFRVLVKNAFFDQALLLGILLCLLLLASGVAHAASVESTDGFFFSAVQAYRKGDYTEALKSFSKIEEEKPGDPNVTYYLAMTYAQLGRFDEARTMYQTVIAIAPGTKSAELAKEGLANLPADASELLVPPPKFKPDAPKPIATTISPADKKVPEEETGEMTQEDVAAWQAMMMQMGGGNNNNMGGMNPMMMMPQQQGGKKGFQMDPNAFSSMMMNQMLQNFDMNSSDKDR